MTIWSRSRVEFRPGSVGGLVEARFPEPVFLLMCGPSFMSHALVHSRSCECRHLAKCMFITQNPSADIRQDYASSLAQSLNLVRGARTKLRSIESGNFLTGRQHTVLFMQRNFRPHSS